MDTVTVEASGLTRVYGNRAAVNDVSFTLSKGEVLGFLGPNGAGKSTTMKMLTGNLAASAGTVKICGIDIVENPKEAKALIGYLPEQPPLYRELTVSEFLALAARLHRVSGSHVKKAVQVAMERCGLTDMSKRLIENLSKGYQQRVGIAQAIIHRPAVIVLDEPTVGLDPTQIREIRTLIRELGDHSSVILSTHLLSEVESVCDRVEIMHHGRLIYGDTSAHMQQYGRVSGFIVSLGNPPPLGVLESIAGVGSVEQLSATQFRVLHTPESNPKSMLLTMAEQQGWRLEQLTPLQATLEEVFAKITEAETSTTGVNP